MIAFHAVTLDCPSAPDLAAFYGRLLGGEVQVLDAGWAAVVTPTGRLQFQTVRDYVRPTWPDPAAPGRVHLDLLVADRATAEALALDAGAALMAEQPNADHCTVLADPAGHVFCLTTWADPVVDSRRPRPR